MKKTILLLAVFFCALAIYAQDPIVKFYLNDGNQPKQYKIKDISEMNFIQPELPFLMYIYSSGSKTTYDIRTIESMSFVDSTKLAVKLSQTTELIDINKIDSIIFIISSCSDITIGTQTWMCENLNVDRYRNGDSIPQVIYPVEWSTLTTGAWCYYDNYTENGKTYGKLYNWYAVNDPRGLAPVGWHIPSDAEWTTLAAYLGGEPQAGGKLKESGTAHWRSPNFGATNETGFLALPGGLRLKDGSFLFFSSDGSWWSSNDNGKSNSWYYAVNYSAANLTRGSRAIETGLSVRCLQGEAVIPVINNIIPAIGYSGDEVILNGSGFGESRSSNSISFNSTQAQATDYISWSDKQIKVKVPKGAHSGKVSATVNGNKSNEIDFTVLLLCTERNSYTTLKIGNQEWMGENLDVCYYHNGDPIPQITDSTEWKNMKTGAWCYYNNDTNNGKTYGKLYNWYAVNDSRGLAPVGWHVSEDEDWKTLEKYIGMSKSFADSTGYRGTDEGGKLKEAGYDHWRKPNAGATNAIGFTALPGSYRGNQGAFYSIGKDGYWWSSTVFDTSDVWFRGLSYYYPGVYRNHNSKEYGFSVRCVKGEIVFPIINKINPSTGFIGDEITLTGTGFGDVQGTSTVMFNSSKPLPNNYLSWSDTEIKVKVPNGTKSGKVWVTVNGRQSNEVDFQVLIRCTERSYYSSVKIGPLVWMGENLDVCYYRNGDLIPEVTDSVKWKNLKTGAWCYSHNDPVNGKIYGKLYNWYAVNDPRGLAPAGWHVPSNAEWTYLADYFGPADVAGGKLKEVGSTHWLSTNVGATDEFGFKALPAAGRGHYSGNLRFSEIGTYTRWWSSDNAYSNYIPYNQPSLSRDIYYQNDGFSVRCVKNYNPDTIPCGGRSSYTPVTVGTQVWMGENLDVCTYRNGDPIPQVEDSTEWKNLKTGAWCYYKNEPYNGKVYGKLYNWYAVNDPRGLAPDGWEVADDEDWTQLTNYLDGNYETSYKLKEAGTTHWPNANVRATDEYGFTALPSGYHSDFGNFVGIEYYTKFWSSTESGQTKAWSRSMSYLDSVTFIRSDYPKANGFAVRCVKVNAIVPVINSIIPDNGFIGDLITINGANFGASQGTNYVSFNSIKPHQNDYWDWSNTQIIVKVPAGAATGNISLTVDGTQGNKFNFIVKSNDPVCEPVTIGTQIWSGKNLDVSTYRNGDTIPQVTDALAWKNLKTGAWCYYKNDLAEGGKFGKLYNRYAVSDSRGLAPAGWHIPSDEEWTTLTNYLGGENNAGGKLKSMGTSKIGNGIWQTPNQGATNQTGFSALPGGACDYDGVFKYKGYFGFWWGFTKKDHDIYFLSYCLDYSNTKLFIYGNTLYSGFAIRCIKD